MGHLERGEKNVSFRSIERVANAFGITLSELFAGLETGNPSPPARSRRDARSVDRSLLLNQVVIILQRAVRSLKTAVSAEESPTARPSGSAHKGSRRR